MSKLTDDLDRALKTGQRIDWQAAATRAGMAPLSEAGIKWLERFGRDLLGKGFAAAEQNESKSDYVSHKCPNCHDQLFIHRGHFTDGKYDGDVGWFCESCDDAKLAEAGYWFDKVYPLEGKKRAASPVGRASFEAYRKRNRFRADMMEISMQQLRAKYERRRRDETEQRDE